MKRTALILVGLLSMSTAFADSCRTVTVANNYFAGLNKDPSMVTFQTINSNLSVEITYGEPSKTITVCKKDTLKISLSQTQFISCNYKGDQGNKLKTATALGDSNNNFTAHCTWGKKSS